MRAYVRCGEGGAAFEVLETMVAAGHAPAMSLTDVLLQSADAALLLACDRSAPAQLAALLSELSGAGLVPTAPTAARVITRLASAPKGAEIALQARPLPPPLSHRPPVMWPGRISVAQLNDF